MKQQDSAQNQSPAHGRRGAAEEQRRADRGIEDWEMVERMSEPQPGILTWFRTVIGLVVLGIAVTALLIYAVHYFTVNYGLHLLY
jgi:hypothetical protein